MTTWRKVQGDVKDTIIAVLSGVEDLATATGAEAHAWRKGVASTTLVATITNPTTRTVSVALGGVAGWLSSAGPPAGGDALDWDFEIQVTWADGTVLTWPAETPDTIIVRAAQ